LDMLKVAEHVERAGTHSMLLRRGRRSQKWGIGLSPKRPIGAVQGGSPGLHFGAHGGAGKEQCAPVLVTVRPGLTTSNLG
jgi:hypothetical protein